MSERSERMAERPGAESMSQQTEAAESQQRHHFNPGFDRFSGLYLLGPLHHRLRDLGARQVPHRPRPCTRSRPSRPSSPCWASPS